MTVPAKSRLALSWMRASAGTAASVLLTVIDSPVREPSSAERVVTVPEPYMAVTAVRQAAEDTIGVEQ
jgi:hypothetical protein